VKPFSEACERNREPILEVLREAFATARRVLEIGSGTGQHAVFFAEALPHLLWQTADLPEAHAGILSWLEEAAMPNVLAPLELDVNRFDWQGARYDAVFSANTAHILSWPEVEQMFAGVGMALPEGGVFCLYGPFKQGGRHTSESNARFDAALRERDPRMGLRDVQELRRLAERHGLILERDVAMPASNRTLVWRRRG